MKNKILSTCFIATMGFATFGNRLTDASWGNRSLDQALRHMHWNDAKEFRLKQDTLVWEKMEKDLQSRRKKIDYSDDQIAKLDASYRPRYFYVNDTTFFYHAKKKNEAENTLVIKCLPWDQDTLVEMNAASNKTIYSLSDPRMPSALKDTADQAVNTHNHYLAERYKINKANLYYRVMTKNMLYLGEEHRKTYGCSHGLSLSSAPHPSF